MNNSYFLDRFNRIKNLGSSALFISNNKIGVIVHIFVYLLLRLKKEGQEDMEEKRSKKSKEKVEKPYKHDVDISIAALGLDRSVSKNSRVPFVRLLPELLPINQNYLQYNLVGVLREWELQDGSILYLHAARTLHA